MPDDAMFRAPTLSRPRVEPLPDEALSSWLMRIGAEHGLTLEELAAEIGANPHTLDCGATPEHFERVALRTRVPADLLATMTHPGLSPARSVAGVPEAWAACRDCLEEDAVRGAPFNIRRAWTHPLSGICHRHQAPLLPVGQLDVDLVGKAAMGEAGEIWLGVDSALEHVAAEEREVLVEAAHLVDCPGQGGGEPLAVRYREVADIVDALSVRMNVWMGPGPLLGAFEMFWRKRSVRGGNVEAPRGILAGLEAAERLRFLRVALRILGPVDGRPFSDAGINAWLADCLHLQPGWAVRPRRELDPLAVVGLGLPIRSFHDLSQRSHGWSPAVRRRWRLAGALRPRQAIPIGVELTSH